MAYCIKSVLIVALYWLMILLESFLCWSGNYSITIIFKFSFNLRGFSPLGFVVDGCPTWWWYYKSYGLISRWGFYCHSYSDRLPYIFNLLLYKSVYLFRDQIVALCCLDSSIKIPETNHTLLAKQWVASKSIHWKEAIVLRSVKCVSHL